MKGDREKFLNAGMDDYLAKPFKIAQLKLILDQWLPESSLLNERKTGTTFQSDHEREMRQSGDKQSLTPEGEPVIDVSFINNIKSLQRPGRPDLLNKVIEDYFSVAPRLIDAIHQGIAAGDATALQNAAHSFKSSSANVGASSLAALCRQLEAIGHAHSTKGAEPLLRQIEILYPQVHDTLADIQQEERGRAWREPIDQTEVKTL